MFNLKMVCLAVYLAILISTVSSLPSPLPGVLFSTRKPNNRLHDFPHYNGHGFSLKSETLPEVGNHPDDSHQGEHQPNVENHQQPQDVQSGGPFLSTVSEDNQDMLDSTVIPIRNVSTHDSSGSSETTEANREKYDPECYRHLDENEQLLDIMRAFDSARPESSSASPDSIAADDDEDELLSEHYYGRYDRPYNSNGFSSTVSLDDNEERLSGESSQLIASYDENNHIFMSTAINRTKETLHKLNSILDVFGFRPIILREQMNSEQSESDSRTPARNHQSSNRERSVRDRQIIEWENLVEAIVSRLEDVSIEFGQFQLR